MANSIQYVYRILDRYSTPLTQISRVTDRFRNIAHRTAQRIRRLQAQMGSMGEKAKDIGSNLSLRVTAPLLLIGGMALKSAAELETLTTSFVSLLGSSEKAGAMVKKLTDFTAKTPFQLQGVGQSAKQLLSFGVQQDKLLKRLKMLGDISAGASIPLTDMSAIFGKIKSKGKAMTDELLQLAERGIPIIDILAKKLKKPKSAIFEMASESKLSFALILESMQGMTSKSGIYFDQMGKQSETLAGIFSTFKDNVSLLLGDVGQTIAEVLDIKGLAKSAIKGLAKVRDWLIKMKETNPFILKTGVILAALAAIAGPLIVAVGMLATAIGALSLPIIAVIAAVAGIAAAFAFWIKSGNPLIDTLKSIGSLIWDTASSFLEIFGVADGGSAIMSAMASVFSNLGVVISGLLKPLEAVLIGLNTTVKVARDLISLDFGKSFESIKGGFSKVKSLFGFGNEESKVTSLLGLGDENSKSADRAASSAIKTRATEQNVNVGGTIRVAADPGAKVTNMTPDLNVGSNMEWALF